MAGFDMDYLAQLIKTIKARRKDRSRRLLERSTPRDDSESARIDSLMGDIDVEASIKRDEAEDVLQRKALVSDYVKTGRKPDEFDISIAGPETRQEASRRMSTGGYQAPGGRRRETIKRDLLDTSNEFGGYEVKHDGADVRGFPPVPGGAPRPLRETLDKQQKARRVREAHTAQNKRAIAQPSFGPQKKDKRGVYFSEKILPSLRKQYPGVSDADLTVIYNRDVETFGVLDDAMDWGRSTFDAGAEMANEAGRAIEGIANTAAAAISDLSQDAWSGVQGVAGDFSRGMDMSGENIESTIRDFTGLSRDAQERAIEKLYEELNLTSPARRSQLNKAIKTMEKEYKRLYREKLDIKARWGAAEEHVKELGKDRDATLDMNRRHRLQQQESSDRWRRLAEERGRQGEIK